jgi:hypothetical protein
MLDREWDQQLRQLLASCGASTKFFSFVDTVSAGIHAGTNGSSIKAFVGYSQDTLGQRSEGRFGESYEPEEGVNRSQPNVTAVCAYAPISFQVIEEGPEKGWFQNFHGQLRRRRVNSGTSGGEARGPTDVAASLLMDISPATSRQASRRRPALFFLQSGPWVGRH